MITYNIHHVDGLYFELTGDEGKNREYDISFIDRSTNKIIYETKLKVNNWARLERKYLSDLAVIVRYEGRTIKQINFLHEMQGKRVFISFESNSLGDTIAWIPYCKQFAEVYKCKVIVCTFNNFLFKNAYPELEFVERGVANNLIAMFRIGWFFDESKEPINPNLIPLQQTASNILHLPFQEIVTKIDFTPKQRPVVDKYVCISIYSTAQIKLWYYWQDVIDNLVSKGYKVFEISKENEMMGIRTSDYNNLTPFLDKSLENTKNYIYHSEFFIGLSSGISWLSWALGKKVIMISNFTKKEHEFQSNCIRITDESVCHGCWNNPKFKFNKGDWNWCPEHEGTSRQFECHKNITQVF